LAIRRLRRYRLFDLLHDLPPPRHEKLHHLLVRLGQPAGADRGAASPTLCSTSFIRSITILVARPPAGPPGNRSRSSPKGHLLADLELAFIAYLC